MAISQVDALNSSVTALIANQQALNVLSNNVANANDTSYSSQNISFSPVVNGGISQGTELDTVTRNSNAFLVAASREQYSQVGTTEVLDNYYQQIQSYYGTPDSSTDSVGSGNSITDALNQFYSAADALASNPADASSQTAALDQAENLASNIKDTAQNLYNTQLQADADIGSAVTYINSQLKNLESVNLSIQSASQDGQSTATLLDQRDTALQNIAQYIGISVSYQSNGEAAVSTNTGVTLLSSNGVLYQLSYTQAGSVQSFINGNVLQPINVYQASPDGTLASSTPSDQLVSGGVIGATSGPDVITSKVSSGELAGLLQMRDTEIPNLLGQLNNMTTNLVNAANAIQNNGSGFPPANTLTGTRAITSTEKFATSGSVMIGVTDSNGNPLPSPYANQTGGIPPLTLNLNTLDGGQPTAQDIVNAINQYYGSPPTEVELGNMNNIQLQAVSDTAATGSNFTFNALLKNYSADNASFQVTGLTITPAAGPAGTVVSGVPSVPNTVTAGTMSNSPNITVNFTAGSTGPWTLAATVQVTDATTGAVSNDVITYQVNPAASGLEGQLYNFTGISGAGDAIIVPPSNSQAIAQAQIVDANGNPVPPGYSGFLQISTINPSNGVAISELDSSMNGQINPLTNTVIPGTDTNQAFADYFQLNDLFVRQSDGTSNALNMAVRSSIQNNPQFISTGQLTAVPAPAAGTGLLPSYTYTLGTGNNQAAENLLNLQNQSISFAAVTGLPATTQTLSGYATQLIGYAANQVSAASSNATNAQGIFTGLQQQAQSVSGVNVDQEMALMIQLQNSYAAAAKVITTMQSIFTALQNAIS